MALVKDAQYYLDRINDLSSSLLSQIENLKKAANSSRFVCLTINELCQKLSFEYTNQSFTDEPQKNYVLINTFLEKFGLKLVPAFVPKNIFFEDEVFVTKKPDLNNDEDCSYVRELIKSKRQVTAKDGIHISRMNEKLANYNVLLRVFESLSVVCSNCKIDVHQKEALNKIIYENVMPKEGQDFLRTCYTFACEHQTYKCDYAKPEYCFKRLNDEQQKRVSSYLAYLAANRSYLIAFSQDYPDLSILEAEYKKLGAIQKKQTAITNDEDFTDLKNAGIAPFSKEMEMAEKVRHCLFKIKPDGDDIDIDKLLCFSPFKENSLCYNILKIHAKYSLNKQTFMNKNNTKLVMVNDPNFGINYEFLVTDNEQLSYVFPFLMVVSDLNAPDKALENQIKNIIKSYITTNNTRWNVVSDIKEFNFFARLTLYKLFVDYDKLLDNQCIIAANQEFIKSKNIYLLFYVGFSFALFDLCIKRSDKLTLPPMVKLALFYFPQLTYLCLQILLNSGRKKSLSDYYEYAKELFDLFLINNIDNKNLSLHSNLSGKCNTHYFIDFLLDRLKTRITKDNCHEFICIKNYGDEEDLEKGSITSEQSWNINANYNDASAIKKGYNLTTKIISRNKTNYAVASAISSCVFFGPLLDKITLDLFTHNHIELTSNFTTKLLNYFAPDRAILRFLYNCDYQQDNTIARILTRNIDKSLGTTLKHNLSNFVFTDALKLSNKCNCHIENKQLPFVEEALTKIGLIIVPLRIESVTSQSKLFPLKKVINSNLDEKKFTPEFINKLKAAQLSQLIFRVNAPLSRRWLILPSLMELDETEQSFVIKFLENFNEISKHITSLTKSFYLGVYKNQHKFPEVYKLTLDYLVKLAYSEIEKSAVSSYLSRTFNKALSYLKGQQDIEDQKEAIYKSTLNQNSTTNTSRQERQTSTQHSFFKPVQFNVEKLDTSLIESKLKESSEIQSFISQLREDENGIVEEDPNLDAQELNENENQNDRLEDDTSTESNSQNGIEYPSENSQKLLQAIKAQNSEIMDLNEFAGLCKSMKFMSQDAAIEEVNDWAYENFDAPILDVSYEENCVYLTTEILEKL